MNTARLDAPLYRHLSWLLLAGVVAGIAWSALVGHWFDAAVLGGFAALAGLFLRWQDELPRLIALLFLIAGLANAVGYAFDLWHTPRWFDEVVHFYTSFAVMAGLGWIALARTRLFGRSLQFVLGVAGFGVVLGILWEVFEYAIGIIGTRRDTFADLLMDMLGAIAAGLFCAWAAGEAGPLPAGHPSEKARLLAGVPVERKSKVLWRLWLASLLLLGLVIWWLLDDNDARTVALAAPAAVEAPAVAPANPMPPVQAAAFVPSR